MDPKRRGSERRLTRSASGLLPLEILHEQVLDAIERQSLRAVARDVGLSPSGLQKFAD